MKLLISYRRIDILLYDHSDFVEIVFSTYLHLVAVFRNEHVQNGLVVMY